MIKNAENNIDNQQEMKYSENRQRKQKEKQNIGR